MFQLIIEKIEGQLKLQLKLNVIAAYVKKLINVNCSLKHGGLFMAITLMSKDILMDIYLYNSLLLVMNYNFRWLVYKLLITETTHCITIRYIFTILKRLQYLLLNKYIFCIGPILRIICTYVKYLF